MAIIPGILSMRINTVIQSTTLTLINTHLKYGPPNKTKQSVFGQASPESHLLSSSILYTYSSCFNSCLHYGNTMPRAPLGLAPQCLSARLPHPPDALALQWVLISLNSVPLAAPGFLHGCPFSPWTYSFSSLPRELPVLPDILPQAKLGHPTLVLTELCIFAALFLHHNSMQLPGWICFTPCDGLNCAQSIKKKKKKDTLKS